MLQPGRSEQPLDLFHVIQSLPCNLVKGGWLRFALRYVRKRWDQLERQASPVTHLDERLQDFREVYVAEAGGETIGVGEVNVVKKVTVGEDGAGDRRFFYVHVEGVSHDAAVQEARLAPHPHALLQTVQHVGA